MNAQAQPLRDVNLDDPDAVIDGGVPLESSESEETTIGDGETQSTDDEQKPTRESLMQSADLTELQKIGYEAIKEIETFEKRRTEINAQIQAVRGRMDAKGINIKALSMVLQIIKMNEDQLDGFDTSFLMLRKSASLPVQSDMFNFKS